jgi:hypothetical protein
MKSTTDEEIIAVFGQVALLAHIIEDLLRLHVFEARRYGVGNVSKRSVKQVQDLELGKVIREFKRIHPQLAAQAEAYDLLRKVRNKVFHAFCPDVGKDLLTFEGRDQIHALLLEIADLQSRHLKPLKKLHEDLLRNIVSQGHMLRSIRQVETTNDWNAKNITNSELLELVKQLKALPC